MTVSKLPSVPLKHNKNQRPNWAFNADTTMGHRFAILMAHGGTLRTSCTGAG